MSHQVFRSILWAVYFLVAPILVVGAAPDRPNGNTKESSSEIDRLFNELGIVEYDVALLPKVVEHLDSKDPEVLIRACGLVAMHPGRRTAVPKLLKLISHPDKNVRAEAACVMVHRELESCRFGF